MKKILSFAFVTISLGIFAQPRIDFPSKKENFGKVQRGDEVTVGFIFTNTGNQPLIINNVKADCDCTKPYWPTEPIAPGKSDSIIIYFNTAHTYDRQDRVVQVYSNAGKEPQELRFKGVVLKRKD